MAYSDKVLDHYENPRNVGSFEDDDNQVGTGMVGAPACFHGDTLIATAEKNAVAIKTLFDAGKDVPVWSYNLVKKQFEIKKARPVYSGKKLLHKILIDGETCWVTPDHKFLMVDGQYKENQAINADESIQPFYCKVDKRGYWEVRNAPNRQVHLELYKTHHSIDYALEGQANVDHINSNKRDNRLENLALLSCAEHNLKTQPLLKQAINQKNSAKLAKRISKSVLEAALERNDTLATAANSLNIFTDELYHLAAHYGIQGFKAPKTADYLRQATSHRMKQDNPYHKMDDAWKQAFATHAGDTNGRWIDVANDDLLKAGNSLFRKHNKLTNTIWVDFAKQEKLPQNLTSRFNTFNEFKQQAIHFNHRIEHTTETQVTDCYTLQVEENNNYVVISETTQNIQSGIVVKNCGDVMRLQIKVSDEGVIEDAKFKTYGCGSAIASSSLLTEWVQGKTLDEALQIKNKDIAEELALPPVKIHCSVLAEDSIKAAIEDYKKKQG